MTRTLVVDDSWIMQDTIKALFAFHFPDIILDVASSGKQAMEKMESFRPDLVIMDIQLPDASGLELTRRLKASHSGIRVLILTGNNEPEYMAMAPQFGADAIFVKGESFKEMVAALKSFLQ
ncbi:MAG TPA: response regulator transcription factor [Thermodesulfobacteriota bacterium]|nr:response regulator transcription factor [Thermodesulfobacteriota bacterium]